MSTELIISTAETLADLITQLGDIPPHRILLHPQPGTATEDDVLRLEAAANKRLCELIDGVLVEKAMGFQESLIAAYLVEILRNFVKPRKLGVVLSSDGMMRILPSQIRIPDVSYLSWDRLPGRKIPQVQVPRLAPNLAIEVLSPSNTEKEMDRKRTNYFTGGTLEVWEVLIPTREVIVYFPDGNFTQYGENGVLTTAVLPGLELPIAEMFAELDETG
jgi:Uma2 family endonuclease